MIRTVVVTLGWLALMSSNALAQNQLLTAPPDPDPRVGEWVMNIGESQPVVWGDYKLLESYHSQTVVREGNDLVITEHIGPRHWCCYAGSSRADSEPTDQTFRLTCDEKPHPLDSSTVTCRNISSNVMEGETVYKVPDVLLGKTKTSYWRTEISSDGKKMTDSAYKDPDRKKLLYRSVYDRKP